MTARPHWSFWLVSVLFLLSSIGGCFNFVVQLDADMLANYPEGKRAIIENRPLWATAGFAVAVFSSVIGCILLLLRKSIAVHVFILALIGTIITMAHAIGIIAPFGMVQTFSFVITPLIMATFFVYFTRFFQRKGWLT